MKESMLNEINNIKHLFNYDRSKTVNEQQVTPVPTPSVTGSTQTPVPTPPAGTPPVPTPATPQPTPAVNYTNVKEGGPNDPNHYKFVDDGITQKYYYAKKGQTDWKQSTNPQSVDAIKKNIFKIL